MSWRRWLVTWVLLDLVGCASGADPCFVVNSAGCPTGQKCILSRQRGGYALGEAYVSCGAAGQGMEGSSCASDADCAAGFGCGGLEGATQGSCRRYCSHTSDCGGDSRCLNNALRVQYGLPDDIRFGLCSPLAPLLCRSCGESDCPKWRKSIDMCSYMNTNCGGWASCLQHSDSTYKEDFCGVPCDIDGTCPSGFACEQMKWSEGSDKWYRYGGSGLDVRGFCLPVEPTVCPAWPYTSKN